MLLSLWRKTEEKIELWKLQLIILRRKIGSNTRGSCKCSVLLSAGNANGKHEWKSSWPRKKKRFASAVPLSMHFLMTES